jgi:hypothetical protein
MDLSIRYSASNARTVLVQGRTCRASGEVIRGSNIARARLWRDYRSLGLSCLSPDKRPNPFLRPRRLSWSLRAYFFSHFASASRFSFAQSLSCCTAFSGGPPFGPHAQTPPVFAIVMQEHDLVFKHAQTYTTSFLFCLSDFVLLRVPFSWPPKEDKLSNEKDKAVSAAARLPNFSQSFISRPSQD